LIEYRNSNRHKIKGEEDKYRSKHIERFKNQNNWFTWKKKFYDMLFTEHGTYREADERKIIFIEDLKGKTGKSKFWKYLYSKDSDTIEVLNEATSNQLKSNIVKLGGKNFR